MSQFLQDIRFAARGLRRPTGLTAILVLTLGIAANCAIFSIVNAVLLQPFDFENPDGIVRLWQRYSLEAPEQTVHFSEVELADLRRNNRAFTEIGGYFVELKTLITDRPEQVLVSRTSPEVFTILGVPAEEGRFFRSEEQRPGQDRVVVLSHQTAEERFGGAAALGEDLRIDGSTYEVVGVMPPDFRFPPRHETGGPVEMWIPETLDTTDLPIERSGAHGRYLSLLARLRPDTTVEQAQAALDAVGRRFQEAYPQAYMESKGYGMEVERLMEAEVSDIRPALWALMGAGILTLLVTCLNVGILLLTQAYKRRREFALRAALGAGRQRIVRQLVTEGLVLASVGGVLGLALAYWILQALLSAIPPEIPRLDEVGLDFAVFGFTLLLVAVSGFLSGVAPLFLLSHRHLADEVKQGGARAGGQGHRFRNALLVAEIAVAMVVLIATGLLIKNFVLLQETDPGFVAEGRLTMDVTMPLSKYNSAETIIPFQRELLDRLETRPGVDEVGFVSHLPLGGTSASWGISAEGHPVPPDEGLHQVDFQVVSPGYFDAMGIEMVDGGSFPEPGRDGPPWYIIVDERVAQRYWPNESPVGKRVRRGRAEDDRPWNEIVGVVRHVETTGVNDDSERDQVYYPYTQVPYPYITLVIETGLEEPESLASMVRREVGDLDREQPVGAARTMESWVAESLAKPRFSMLLFLLFAGVTILLVIGGTYGLFNAVTLERRRDIGIRIAIGAEESSVLRSVLKQSLVVAILGIGVGLVLALGGTRYLETQLYGVSSMDLTVFVVMPAVLVVILLLASLPPARRAAKTDPMRVLREE